MKKRIKKTRRRDALIEDFILSLYLIKKSPLSLAGLIIALAFFILGLLGPYIAPHDPLALSFKVELPPSLEHPFGTDFVGRDMLSRVLHATSLSLRISMTVVFLSSLFGVLFGVIAGYSGGRVDELIMRVTDVFLAVPALLLAIAIGAVLGPSIENTILAIAIHWIPVYTRLVRSVTLVVRESEYVKAARAMGAKRMFIITNHVIPNSLTPILTIATLDIGAVILIAATLSFIGLGAQPPTPELGLMVAEGREGFPFSWWMSVIPGLMVFVITLGYNLLGDALRDIFDPKTRRRIEVN